jgi:GMP synthase-like glutamine amidotransferase
VRALVIRQHTLSKPGTIGDYAKERGFELVHHVAAEDGKLPPAAEFDFILPMGAPWSVYGEEVRPWIEDQLRLFRDAVESDVPVLGVCFGAQAFAQALGGVVRRAERPELGWGTVRTADPDLVPEGPWFMWHSDVFTLPPGARLLADTDSGPQAYTYGKSLLVQFHPEVSPGLLQDWCNIDASDFERLGVSVEDVRAETERRSQEARERARRLFDAFLANARAAV